MILLLTRKLTLPFKFPSDPNKPKPPAASLHNFRSRISGSITQIGFEPDPGLNKWFDLINTTNTAFAKMVVEVGHPTTRWSERLTEEYLNHTLNLLSLLNSVTSLIIKGLDSRFFCKEVNLETECVFADTRYCSEPELGDSIEGLEKRLDNMFFEVLASRNKLLDTLRLTRHNT